MIRFENVSKIYQDGTLSVNALNLTIKKGEFFVFIGPSGCGKTTTLKMINRLVELSEGTISINDKRISDYDIHELRWNIGYVLQQIALFPHMTIEENIAIVPELRKWERSKIKERVKALLEMVGLDPETYQHRKPSELSGGEQQRVGVVRALAADPEIILMDEPFSALDPISREKLQHDILDLQQRIKKTIVFVTHDMKEALALGDRIGVMRDGQLIQVDTPNDIVHHPADEFVAEFISERQTIRPDWENEVTVEDMILPILDGQFSTNMNTIPHTTTLQHALKRLTTEEMITVEKDNEIIGMIDRPTLLKYISERIEVRG